MSDNAKLSIVAAAAAATIVALTLTPEAFSEPLAPPAASVTASPNPADVGELVTFDGSGSTGDGAGSTISTYEWDLNGDGDFEVNTGANPTTSLSYPEAAMVTIRLRVTDSEGDIDEASVVLRINAGPKAGFSFDPSTPAVDERVSFSSTSTDPDGQIASSGYRWDFNGDGQFADAVGKTVTASFRTAGVTTVGLQVTDSDGATNVKTKKVSVERSPPKLLSPFPLVRLSGEVRGGGSTEIDRLSVRAPRGSEAAVRCRGESCPFREMERTVRRRRVRFGEIEGRLRPGALIEIFVTKPQTIGKYTRFRIREGAVPKRRDRCLAPGTRKPISCPPS